MSISFIKDYSTVVKNAISEADARGCLIIAAGHLGEIITEQSLDVQSQYPACYPKVFTVAASDKNDQMWEFSCYGNGENDPDWDGVAVLAPGEDIPIAFSEWDITGKRVKGIDYEFGTSFAAPHVAGEAAFIWATTSNPDLTNTQVKNIIKHAVNPIIVNQSDDWFGKVGSGRINVHKALLGVTTPPQFSGKPIPDENSTVFLINNKIKFSGVIVDPNCGIDKDTLEIEIDGQVPAGQTITIDEIENGISYIYYKELSEGSHNYRVYVDNNAGLSLPPPQTSGQVISFAVKSLTVTQSSGSWNGFFYTFWIKVSEKIKEVKFLFDGNKSNDMVPQTQPAHRTVLKETDPGYDTWQVTVRVDPATQEGEIRTASVEYPISSGETIELLSFTYEPPPPMAEYPVIDPENSLYAQAVDKGLTASLSSLASGSTFWQNAFGLPDDYKIDGKTINQWLVDYTSIQEEKYGNIYSRITHSYQHYLLEN